LSLAQQRNQLAGQFRELARNLEKLHDADPDKQTEDGQHLDRWQALYGNDVTNVLQNRAVLDNAPATANIAKLTEWIDYAQQIPIDERLNRAATRR
jgi:hypothetical protein